MKNNAHDSIGGCSIDKVHRDVMDRFATVEEISSRLKDKALRSVVDRIYSEDIETDAQTARKLVVFNPHTNQSEGELIETTVALPAGEKYFLLKDAEGYEIQYQITGEKTLDDGSKELDIVLPALGVPAMGYKTYFLHLSETAPDIEGNMVADGMTADNDFISLEFFTLAYFSEYILCHLIMDFGNRIVDQGSLNFYFYFNIFL